MPRDEVLVKGERARLVRRREGDQRYPDHVVIVPGREDRVFGNRHLAAAMRYYMAAEYPSLAAEGRG